jgi:hypothetical protein
LEERTRDWWWGEATGINTGWKEQQGMILIRGSNQEMMVGGINRD